MQSNSGSANNIIQTLRARIWAAAKLDISIVERAKKGIKLDPGIPQYWEAVLMRTEELMKPKRNKKPKVDLTTQESRNRYRAAKWAYESRQYPSWVKDGHFLEPDYPNCGESNGLTEWIMRYITWTSGRATRVSSAGRKLPNGKFIPSTTRKGTADVSSTINGKSVMWEVKAGSDTPSPLQLKEQERERRAGGEYFFTHSAEEFFTQYDSIVSTVNQKELF